jgi:hypothetical protein
MLEWWGPIIHEYYAGTEDIGSTWITAQEWLAHPGSVGRPLTPAHIVGPDGEELGPGQEGTVYFEGGRPFEYHNDPDKTASITDSRGWRTLGDVGLLDEDGYLYLTDRQAHMIISGESTSTPRKRRTSSPAILGRRRRRLRRPRPRDGRSGEGGGPAGRPAVGRPRPRSRTDRLTAAAGWPPTNAPGRSTSRPSSPGIPMASSTNGSSATATGRATTPASSEDEKPLGVANCHRFISEATNPALISQGTVLLHLGARSV